jgi:hypothetical protein
VNMPIVFTIINLESISLIKKSNWNLGAIFSRCGSRMQNPKNSRSISK